MAQTAETMGMGLRDIRAVLLGTVDLCGLSYSTLDGKAQWCPTAFLPSDQDGSRGLFLYEHTILDSVWILAVIRA